MKKNNIDCSTIVQNVYLKFIKYLGDKMKELLEKENLVKEELSLLDEYYSSEHVDELLVVDNKYIVRLIELTEKELGFSLTKTELKSYLLTLTFEYRVFFCEDDINLYIKMLELIYYFFFDDAGLAYILGDYYFNNNNKTEALKYYKLIFKKGFNLSNEEYFYSLSRYLELLDNKINVLKELIDSSPKEEYNIEFIDTYLLLINCLDKKSEEYLKYIDEALTITTPLVRDYQKDYTNDMISDSDVERNLCELLSLKMEYYVFIKDYLTAYELYNELTKEIRLSGCTRYYHARDLFYYQMLKSMSEEYPELKFFNNISHKTFKIISEYDDLGINQEITLEDESNNIFKFIITEIRDSNDVVIAPILPLLGVGALIFTILIKNEEEKYLKNTF